MIQNLPSSGNDPGTSYPRSIIRIDGYESYFDEWTVTLNDTHQADTFELYLPFLITEDAQQSYLVATPDAQSLLFTKDQILIEVFVGHPDDPENFTVDDLERIMYGYMDTVELDCEDGEEQVVVQGRNMAAPFLDNKLTAKWQNMTSSAIAQMLAKSHGLQSQVTATQTLAGTYYNGDNVNMSTDMTEWDLLSFLADQEGFVIRVRDNTLYFGPFDTVIGTTTDPVPVTWGENVTKLSIQRSPHAAKNIVIEVHSYQATGTKRHIKATAKATKANASDTFTERYYFPGLTQDQAQQKAEAILQQFSRMELIGSLEAGGDERFVLDHQVILSGVGAVLSQNYFIQKAEHHFIAKDSPEYTCTVDFSNLLLQDENTGGF